MTLLMAIACGVAAANIYYNQPMLGIMEAAFPGQVTVIGLVPTATQLGFAAGLLLLVPLGDRFDRRRLILIQLAALTLSLAAAALAPDAWSLVVASALVGGTSSVAQQIVPFAAELAEPSRRGATIGIVMSGRDGAARARLQPHARKDAFVAVIGDLHAGRAGWPAELECARLWYEPHLDRIHEDAVVRRADLIQLEQIASGYPSRERLLTELTLDPPDATSDQAGVPLLDEDYLILSTIHSAKGQEWKSVFVLNVVDGCLPSDLGTGTSAEIEEERRLLYVAVTRAKDDLHLIVPQRFFTHGQSAQGDRHVYASRTRFIPEGLLGLFDRTSWPSVAVSAPARAASQGVRINVGARMRGMWR
jgi:DNA helicase-2/ATP-dependent DNA helicase PcrA